MSEKIYRVKCKSYDDQGRGIVHFNGSMIPVEGLIPGEMAHIQLKHTKDGTIGILKDIEQKSEDRCEPICKYSEKCGACQLLHMNYEAQLSAKQQIVERLLGDICPVRPIIGMDSSSGSDNHQVMMPVNYRNKVHATFARLRNGQVIAGTYEPKSHRVVDIKECPMQDERANRIVTEIKNLMMKMHVQPYDEDRQRGIMRHVLIRIGKKTNQVMVVLVVGSHTFTGKNNFLKALRHQCPEITTLIINENGQKTSMILGEKEEIVFGPGYIEDELCGVRFRLSSKSFYQVNPVQTEILYTQAIAMAELDQNDVVLDAYCGIGTIGQICAGQVKYVIGVESNPSAVKNARENAKLNHIENVTYFCEDAGRWMQKMAGKQSKDSPVQRPDVVIADPPRSGCSQDFFKAMVKMSPKKVVYISCNPVTLQRDLKWLSKQGYRAQCAQPVEMFVGSSHVESVVLLSRTEGTTREGKR